jgi:hypothetical protein
MITPTLIQNLAWKGYLIFMCLNLVFVPVRKSTSLLIWFAFKLNFKDRILLLSRNSKSHTRRDWFPLHQSRNTPLLALPWRCGSQAESDGYWNCRYTLNWRFRLNERRWFREDWLKGYRRGGMSSCWWDGRLAHGGQNCIRQAIESSWDNLWLHLHQRVQ